MDYSSVFLLCFLVTCSAWTLKGGSLQVSIDDGEQVDIFVEAQVEKLPGLCWTCKWALNKVKKKLSNATTQENVKKQLLAVCDEIGLLKSLCRKFVKSHLLVLVEELTTTDDVRTICVNTGACKPKEALEEFFSKNDAQPWDFEIDDFP